jgi:hypothetical protein
VGHKKPEVDKYIKELIAAESSTNIIARTAIEIIKEKGLMKRFKAKLKKNLKNKRRKDDNNQKV